MHCFPFGSHNQLQPGAGWVGGAEWFPRHQGKEGRGVRGETCPPQHPSIPVHRYERLEEQLNDLTELHQNEMTNLKQELASMEEKVAYQSYERARDIQVGEREGSAPPHCTLHPRGKGGTLGWERGWAMGIPFSSTLQMRSSL